MSNHTPPAKPVTWWTLSTVVHPDGRTCLIQKNDAGCTRIVVAEARTARSSK